jgi:hypothetical protein
MNKYDKNDIKICKILYILMRGVCLRCGKGPFAKLNIHLKNKKICPATYLDVDREKMLANYDRLFKQFDILRKKNKCDICNKFISKSNFSKHRKKHENHLNTTSGTQSIINSGTIDTLNNNGIIINGNNNNITNNINAPITINIKNFGDELDIDIGDIYDIVTEYTKILDSSNPKDDNEYDNIANDAIKKFVSDLHFSKEENMNVYIPFGNGKNGHIYTDNKWQCKARKDIIKMVVHNAIDKLDIGIDGLGKILSLIDNEGHSYRDDLTSLKYFNSLVIKELKNKIKKTEDDDYEDTEKLKDQKETRKAYKKTCDEVERGMIENSEIAKKHFHKTKNISM